MIAKNRKRKTKSRPPTPHYSLAKVRALIDEGKTVINKNALDGARDSFQWKSQDVLNAIKKLHPKHFCKSEEYRTQVGIKIDYYKAYKLNGEDVYTHFYIDDKSGNLIINSFKKI